MKSALRVINSLLTTVQDGGRPKMRRYAVPISGAMDRFALEAANRLVGNPPDAAALEITAGGATFEILTPLLFAVTGGDLGARLDGELLPLWTAVFARSGARLQFVGRREPWGARAYLALAGGVAVPEALGSRSTYIQGGFGGLEGRALRAGDELPIGASTVEPARVAGRSWPVEARPGYRAEPTLRILPGPHAEHFEPRVFAQLCAQPFRVSKDAGRMGYRLEGPQLRYEQLDLPSFGAFPGVVQVPPAGAPILLMADAQTVGGYPVIAVVIAPDLALAAQLLPGDSLRFAPTTIDEAQAARRQLDEWRAVEFVHDEWMDAPAWAGALASDGPD